MCRENRQHYVWDPPLFNNTLTYTYQQEKIPTFILACSVYITCPLIRVKGREIANNDFEISTRKPPLHEKYLLGILQALMWAYLVISYIFGNWWIHGRYNQHYLSDFTIFYSTISIIKFFDIYVRNTRYHL